MSRRELDAPARRQTGGETAGVGWVNEIRAASAAVEDWIQHVAALPGGWMEPRDVPWTNKDLIGHLASWSDVLVDQIDALSHERPEAIVAVDVDAWNATEAARRRDWTADRTVAAWRRSVERVMKVIGRLPPAAWDRSWKAPWAADPVSIADLLRLWLAHLDQHRSRLRAR